MKSSSRRRSCLVALVCLTGISRLKAWPADASLSLTPAAPPTTPGEGRSITLPHFEPELPRAAGREEFVMVCVSCHSARYVTMQPPFPQLQWEETVNKMAKVYGAPINEEQKRAIVGYLVNLQSKAAESSDEEEAAAITGTVPQPHPLAFPTLRVSPDPAEHLAQVNRGADLFHQDCAACHGADGRGDGLVAQVLLPKPADLGAFHFTLGLLGQSLWNGVRGSSMPSWRNLSEYDLNALAAFIQTLHQPDRAPAPAAPSLARGSTLFLQNCAPCHGLLGDGNSALAATLSPPPANLHLKQPDFAHVLQVLQDGVPGTGMPSWKDQLSEPDRAVLAGFVRSLFVPAEINRR